jgi:hypothetical protein
VPYIDLYCERLGRGLFAEPVNAATNAAFLLVGFLLYRRALRGRLDLSIALLLALIFAIGIGSTLFHTFATPWARLLDELPILVFQLGFFWLYARRVAGMGRLASLAALATYLAAAVYARGFPASFNGSLVYLPALLTLGALGAYHAARAPVLRWSLVQAAAVFGIAVILRTLDMPLCDRWPLGTHFLWHLLMALVLYLAMRALLASEERTAASAR